MGITISYSGELDDPTRLDEALPVYVQMARLFGWPVQALEQRIEGSALVLGMSEPVETGRPGVSHHSIGIGEKPVGQSIQGLRLDPPDTEPLYLTFNAEGRLLRYEPITRRTLRAMTTPFEQALAQRAAGTQPPPSADDDEVVYLELSDLWVKTTGATGSHKLIVQLLRHLKEHYVSNLDVRDDTHYWESGAEADLKGGHGLMSVLNAWVRTPGALKGLAELTGIEGLAEATPVVEPEPKKRRSPREN